MQPRLDAHLMNSMGAMRLCVVGLIVVGMARHHAHACENATLGVADPVVQQMIAGGEIHVADPSHNVGVYAWSDVLQQHVLVASHLDEEFLFSPPEPQPGEVIEYVDHSVELKAGETTCETPTLPPVVVTASLPSRTFVGRLFIRIRTILVGGARITSSAGVPVPNNPANPEYSTCTGDEQSRLHHAHRDVAPYTNYRFLSGRALRPRQLVRVTYDDGGTEVWLAVGGMVSATAYSIYTPPVPGTLRCP